MKTYLVLLASLFSLNSLMGEVINPLIATDSVALINRQGDKEVSWWVSIIYRNEQGNSIKIESCEERDFEDREITLGLHYPIPPYRAQRIWMEIPIDYDSVRAERVFVLKAEDGQELGSFRLLNKVPRPLFEKRPAGWTSIREDQIYPLRVSFENPEKETMYLDSLVVDTSETEASFRFQRWALASPLPKTIPAGAKVDRKIRIWTKGLYATVGGVFKLHYHFADGRQGVLPFAHAFRVEPNIWVKDGGQWEVGKVPYGQKLSRNIWLTHEGQQCITLVPEDEALVSLQDTVLCPGDTTYGVVQYPTICDTIGELEAEVALFVKEFNGHVPLIFEGELTGSLLPQAEWLGVADSVIQLERPKGNQTINATIALTNNGPIDLEIRKLGFAGAPGRGMDSRACRKMSLPQRFIPSGETATLTLEIICVDLLRDGQYFVIEAAALACDGLTVQQGVRLELKE